ncbi:sugar ABC transporter substrate-binding protein [Microlunatus endophyticus]|uniref:Sugar ABC transporter substrate-binding protein n=1 Tax=Microlunatus endophyticus TaxID=1716077 RepID=A0A917SHW9_9ACTN|nr:extracellular solute-binding protein [Microlunatus endophyticus]GGL79763.1 sugar ABC transporter substrate-binding protein [Microlunatus endophyticus]
MKKQVFKAAFAAGVVGVLSASLVACSGLTGSSGSSGGSDSGSKADPNAKVTITVGDEPTADEPAAVAQFKKSVAAFEKLYPNITVKPSTETWEAQTFNAKLAAGTLPDTMGVSLTYSQQLIQNHQLPNMTPYLKQLGMLSELNPLAAKQAEDRAGNIYTLPYGLFQVGLSYNRKIFSEAGLDPNKPPSTWAEVQRDAKIIHQKVPKVAGYAQLTTNNTGGWMLTAMTYSMGGRVLNDQGTKTTFGPATTQALQLLHDMRWNDDSMGSQFLYNQDQIRQTFSAGKIGMVLQAPDIYGQATFTYGMKAADFGQTAMPQANGTNGTLTGGTIAMFNAKATPNQLLAAARWVKYEQFQQYFDKNLAIANAKANEHSVNPPGEPGLPPVSDAVNERYLGWIKPYISIPLQNFSGYTSANLKLVPEPFDAQQVYADLDPVVQKILTDKNANIAETLASASKTINGQLGQMSH